MGICVSLTAESVVLTHCPAVSGGTEHVEFAVVEVQMEIDLLRLRHDRHRTGGGMDTSAGLRLGHALHTVYAALVLQSGVRACCRGS